MKRNIHYLMIEDDDAMSMIISREIEAYGYRSDFDRVVSKKEYVRKLIQEEYDLIIAERHMPGFNEEDVLKIRDHLAPCIPVIIMTMEWDASSNQDRSAGSRCVLINMQNVAGLPHMIQTIVEV